MMEVVAGHPAGWCWQWGLDGGLGEGHPQVVVLAQVMVMELDERLDGLLH